MKPLRKLRELWARDRYAELSAEDELLAERLTELLREYVEAELPDSAIPKFRVPAQKGTFRKPRGPELLKSPKPLTSRKPARSRRSLRFPSRGASAAHPHLEVSHEEPR